MVDSDARRRVPRTDTVLADPRLRAAEERLGRGVVKAAVAAVQKDARSGRIAPEDVVDAVVARLPDRLTSLRPVLNATGVVLHTNLGRAPLARGAVDAMTTAAGYVDVEYDLASGRRARRGQGALAALLAAVPAAGAAMVVNNGAAALLLATTALAAGREVLVSRGELVEIGDGFRLPELIEAGGARLREVGTTNRTSLADYAGAVTAETGCILKVHPGNFRISGFTSAVGVADLAALGPPVVSDVGSGLLAPVAWLPDEPDVASALRAGASVVVASGDKLLGGPQAGLVLGTVEVVEMLRAHPLARALRVGKVTLAALEATLRGPVPPVAAAIASDPALLRGRADRLAAAVGGEVVATEGTVGGGSAPGVTLPGWAVALPVAYATALRTGVPPVVGRVEHDRCLLDLRTVPEECDDALRAAVLAVRVADT